VEAAVSITDDDAAAMLHDIADRRGKRSMANQTKNIIHAMFKWGQAARAQVRGGQPVRRSSRVGAKVTRDRFLSAAEIRQVWSALDEPERFDVSQDIAARPSKRSPGPRKPTTSLRRTIPKKRARTRKLSDDEIRAKVDARPVARSGR
jgi:hypothetical protein